MFDYGKEITMNINSFDQDYLEFFSELISDPDEIEIVNLILSGLSSEEIIKKFLSSLEEVKDDSN